MYRARGSAPALFGIGSMSSTSLSLSMVAGGDAGAARNQYPCATAYPSIARATRLLQYPPNAGGADRHDVSVQHHKRQSPIAFQGMFPVEVDDCLLLPRRQPEIAGNPTVVFIDPSVACSPVVELAGSHAQPVDESSGADLGLLRPAPDEIHHEVPHIVRHPHFGQSSPRLFFKAMCSAISSANTSSLVWIFFSRNSIRCCSAWWSGRLLPWKAAAPFSKNSFCQRYNTVGCSPSSSHRSETGTLSNKCRLRMATFSSPV